MNQISQEKPKQVLFSIINSLLDKSSNGFPHRTIWKKHRIHAVRDIIGARTGGKSRNFPKSNVFFID